MNAKQSRFFRELMVRYAVQPGVVERVIEHLAPFRAQIESGEYDLSDPLAIDRNSVANVIASVTGLPVAKIEIISWAALGQSEPKKERESLGEYRFRLSRLVKGDMEVGFRRLFREHWGTTLGTAKAGVQGLDLSEIESALQKSSFDAPLKKALHASHGKKMGNVLHNGIWTCLLYYVAFALRGDLAAMDIVEPVLSLYMLAAPLAQKKGEPTTWVVLTA